MTVTADFLREIIDYDAASGLFRWKVVRGSAKVGQVAGRLNRSGYLQISIGWRKYSAHRLAWLFVHGTWPPTDVDHINGDKSDNRMCNLRLSTDSQNRANAKIQGNSSTGLKGVCFHKKLGKWQATITVNGATRYLGLFGSAEEAHAAYQQAATKSFGEFARFG